MDIQEIIAGLGSSSAVQEAAAKAGLSPDAAQGALQGVLEHVSSGQPAEEMAQSVAGRVGVDPSQIAQFLPSVMGALQQHVQASPEGAQGLLSGLLGSLQNSPFGGALGGLAGGAESGQGGLADQAFGAMKNLFGGAR